MTPSISSRPVTTTPTTTAAQPHHDTPSPSSPAPPVRSYATAPANLRSRPSSGSPTGPGSMAPRSSLPGSSSSAASTAGSRRVSVDGHYVPPHPVSTTPPVTPTGKTIESLMTTLAQHAITHLTARLGTGAAQGTGAAAAAGAGGNAEALNFTSTLLSGAVSTALKKVVSERMKQHAADSAPSDRPPRNTLGESLKPTLMAAAKGMLGVVAGGLRNAAVGTALAPVVQQGLEGRGVSEAVARPLAMMAGSVLQGVVSAAADTASEVAGSAATPHRFEGAEGSHQDNAMHDTAAALGGKAAEALINFGLTLPKRAQETLGQVMEHGSPQQKNAVSKAMAWAGLNA